MSLAFNFKCYQERVYIADPDLQHARSGFPSLLFVQVPCDPCTNCSLIPSISLFLSSLPIFFSSAPHFAPLSMHSVNRLLVSEVRKRLPMTLHHPFGPAGEVPLYLPLIDCPQSPMFSWDRRDIARVTVKCGHLDLYRGVGPVGDYSSRGRGARRLEGL